MNLFLVCCVTFGLSLVDAVNSKPVDEGELILSHVIFRHGDRTPEAFSTYPTDPYANETYYPYGHGELTNEGKMREYNIGRELRERYSTFLDDVYTPNIIEALSSDVNRTKMSLQLVLARLFLPGPEQTFKPGLPWQPIPYYYFPPAQDKILSYVYNPTYAALLNQYLQSPKMQAQLAEHKTLLDYLSLHTGMNEIDYVDVMNLYFTLATQEQWGFQLPLWTEQVYPQALEPVVLELYEAYCGTTELRKHAVGYLLRKILDDTRSKINGTLEQQSKQIFLYSGHEINVAAFLETLDIFDFKIPSYGAYILVEIFRTGSSYGIKIFHQNYDSEAPVFLKLPACDELCPLENFVALVEQYLPTD